jgi:transposase
MALTRDQRAAILELHRQGVGTRTIAKTLKIARGSVTKVIRLQSRKPPPVARTEKAEKYREDILRLHTSCKGNLVRVHEELLALGADFSYPALTAYCRRHEIGIKPKKASGRYHFKPGEEIQHDTSPHKIVIGGKQRKVQTASAVMCFSRRIFFQCYPTFNRFYCKVFLTDALRYFGGACTWMMIDNTHVVVLRGTGADMEPVPEMAAFADRYGFTFRAHEKGDANRSARVEGPFDYIERNFIPGRTFNDWHDLNSQAVLWCDNDAQKYKRSLRASPQELFVIEQPHLEPLPIWVPEVYLLHHRTVDVEGYVALNTNRYSVPDKWIGRQVEVRETKDQVIIDDGPRRRVVHERIADNIGKRVTIKDHRPPRGQGRRRDQLSAEETVLVSMVPDLADYVAAVKKRCKKQTTLALRHLLRMVREYPRKPLLAAVREAAHYGLYDLDRVERMVLRRIANEYFLLDYDQGDGDDE